MLKDACGNVLLSGDVVKRERIIDDKIETAYFVFEKNSFGKYFLFQYDSKGKINESSFNNIRVDESVTLISNENTKWIRQGGKEEIHKVLFKK